MSSLNTPILLNIHLNSSCNTRISAEPLDRIMLGNIPLYNPNNPWDCQSLKKQSLAFRYNFSSWDVCTINTRPIVSKG